MPQDLMKAIETAIRIEQEGQSLYQTAAGITADPTVQELYRALACEEEAHADLFQQVSAALRARNAWPEIEDLEAIALRQSASLALFRAAGTLEAIQRTRLQLEALHFAIRAEKESIDFYQRQLTSRPDAAAERVYSYLIAREEEHLQTLQSILDSLQG